MQHCSTLLPMYTWYNFLLLRCLALPFTFTTAVCTISFSFVPSCLLSTPLFVQMLALSCLIFFFSFFSFFLVVCVCPRKRRLPFCMGGRLLSWMRTTFNDAHLSVGTLSKQVGMRDAWYDTSGCVLWCVDLSSDRLEKMSVPFFLFCRASFFFFFSSPGADDAVMLVCVW